MFSPSGEPLRLALRQAQGATGLASRHNPARFRRAASCSWYKLVSRTYWSKAAVSSLKRDAANEIRGQCGEHFVRGMEVEDLARAVVQ